jgi:hypothetical protein
VPLRVRAKGDVLSFSPHVRFAPASGHSCVFLHTRSGPEQIRHGSYGIVRRGDELLVACRGNGSVHVIDIPNRRHKGSFAAGTCYGSLGFF